MSSVPVYIHAIGLLKGTGKVNLSVGKEDVSTGSSLKAIFPSRWL